MFFIESHLEARENLIRYFARFLELQLLKVNPAFRFVRIETPVLSPLLRSSSTKAAYEVSRELLTSKVGPKYKLPIVLWQHGKIFHAHTEEYVLEFQILFSKTTGAKYFPLVVRSCITSLRKQCGKVFTADEDASGVSIFAQDGDLELVHIRERTDFWGGKCIEITFHLDDLTRVNIQNEFGRIQRSTPIDKK
jgi:hypothetical protein